MQAPKPRKISLGNFLKLIQERLAFGESIDQGQNTAYAVLVLALAKRGACTVEDVTEGLKTAEDDARRMNEPGGTIRELRALRTTLERMAPKAKGGEEPPT